MNVKDAVKTAIEYITDIFATEHPENIGLEEVFLNEPQGVWEVTVGFSRPWDHQKGGLLATVQALTRQYKIVRIDNQTGEVKSIRIRETKNA